MRIRNLKAVKVKDRSRIANWFRRRLIHPVKPACVLGPSRHVQEVQSSSALRARSIFRANRPPPRLEREHLAVEVVIDVPRFGFIKHDDNGNLDYVSLLPCPFNYGSIPGTRSEEGDRFDAIVLGPRLAKGSRVTVPVIGVVNFMDAGKGDPKWICSEQLMTPTQRSTIVVFFLIYERIKSIINAIRRKVGPTQFNGISVSSDDFDRLFHQITNERNDSA